MIGKEITSFEVRVLDQGVMSDGAIITPTYSGEAGPASFALKFPKGKLDAGTTAMYRKELNFYEQLRDEMHTVMPCPKVIGVFRAPANPNTEYCIVMEDMGLEYNGMNSIDGIDTKDALTLVTYAASFHAHYWGKDILKEDWLNLRDANGNIAPTWICDYLTIYIANSNSLIDLMDVVKKGSGVDMMEFLEPCVGLLTTQSAAMIGLIYEILNSRPKTLVHSDFRCENLFKHKTEEDKFCAIDW